MPIFTGTKNLLQQNISKVEKNRVFYALSNSVKNDRVIPSSSNRII